MKINAFFVILCSVKAKVNFLLQKLELSFVLVLHALRTRTDVTHDLICTYAFFQSLSTRYLKVYVLLFYETFNIFILFSLKSKENVLSGKRKKYD